MKNFNNDKQIKMSEYIDFELTKLINNLSLTLT